MKRFIPAYTNLDPNKFQIGDFWDDHTDRYFEVSLGNGYRVAVKFPRLLEQTNGIDVNYSKIYSYIMDCESYGDDLNILFDEWNKELDPPELEITNAEYDAILDFGDENANEYVNKNGASVDI